MSSITCRREHTVCRYPLVDTMGEEDVFTACMRCVRKHVHSALHVCSAHTRTRRASTVCTVLQSDVHAQSPQFNASRQVTRAGYAHWPLRSARRMRRLQMTISSRPWQVRRVRTPCSEVDCTLRRCGVVYTSLRVGRSLRSRQVASRLLGSASP